MEEIQSAFRCSQMKKILLIAASLLMTVISIAQQIVFDKPIPNSFLLGNVFIYVDSNDFALVRRSAELLQQDMEAVTGQKPKLIYKVDRPYTNLIVIGSLTNSAFIKELIEKKLINTKDISGKWEAYQVKVIDVSKEFMPTGNILAITGSDRRGTAYGVFELSKQLGVSPWYWWADVPVKKKTGIYIKYGVLISDAPKVKYRGIFINDEAPAFSGWAKEKFGGINHLVYEKIFELILRLKGNYLWPAMWGNAFNDDDTLSPILADKWGIVMGTSHHEPMLRAQQEWKRYGKGPWNYDSNEVVLKNFWRKGIQNMGTHESIVTVGMRGDGDKPMTEGTATALLERIVTDQRNIIEEVIHKPASATPQLWALYKEVQDYYDKGMRVPDDVTLLLCDDNWGNIRKLPKLTDKPRTGGYGIYYHFDYVGGPRNYKWVNTNPIPRVWEQMHLAYEYGVKNIWIVNVGDLKPMEFPISFWLDYAWNPENIGADDLQKYTEQWAADQFGDKYAKEIADIISKYSKYNGRRKPELLDANTYSINDNDVYNYEKPTEFATVVNDYNSLLKKAEKINEQLSTEYRDAYFQLVLHPVKACANLNEMYYNAALNERTYKSKLLFANEFADKVKQLYANDSLIALQYHQLNNGKWNHMMDQTHIGYTYWQQPSKQVMPKVKYLPADSVTTTQEDWIKTKVQQAIYPPNLHTNAFYELRRYVSIEASHYTKTTATKDASIKVLPDLGRTGDAVTVFPVTAATPSLAYGSPKLEYDIYVYDTGKVKLQAYFSPTLNFHNDEGLKYAVAFDNELPQVIVINKEDNNVRTWEGWVANNIIIKTSNHTLSQPGKHILKIWIISPAVVLQKLVADFGGVKQSYLGPPETKVK
jgi:Glycosyl hydrolase family 115/Gylcosyl hydrolase family 115 C-terminal domain